MGYTEKQEILFTVTDAINICKEIEPKLRNIGYHCGLTGSCLYGNGSAKDIDIIIYPHQKSKQISVIKIIAEIGATTKMYQSQGEMIAKKITPSCTDKLIIVSDYKGTRVDFFFLE